MLRRWLALVLLVLQLQPALAFAPDQASTLAVEFEHALVHHSGQGHHHDTMLAFELDDDGAALQHVHHDASHHSALPLRFVELSVPLGEPAAHEAFLDGQLPDPHLEGPLRPPRLPV